MRRMNDTEWVILAIMAIPVVIVLVLAWHSYSAVASRAYFEQCLIGRVYTYRECEQRLESNRGNF